MKIARALNWKYALGELAIVIVGILIAIQVDAWNQSRIERGLAASYLDRLAVDVAGDREFFEGSMRGEIFSVAAADSMLLWMSRDAAPSKGNLAQSLGGMQHSAPVRIRLATWTDLLATGQIDLIEPAELRDRLLRYYQDVQGRYTQRVDGVERAQLEQYWDYYARLGPQSGSVPPVLRDRFGAGGAFYAPWSQVTQDVEFFQFLDRTRAWSLSVAVIYWHLACEAEEVLDALVAAGAERPADADPPSDSEEAAGPELFDVARVSVDCTLDQPPVNDWVLWPDDEPAPDGTESGEGGQPQ